MTGRILIALSFLLVAGISAHEISKKSSQKESIQSLKRGLLMTEVIDLVGDPESWSSYDDKEKHSFLYKTWDGDCKVYFHRAKLVSTNCLKN